MSSEMLLEEFRVANGILRAAIGRYFDACVSIKHSLASRPYQLKGLMSSTLANELPMLADYEAKLLRSKIAIFQSINLCPDVVPARVVPVETLVHVFQLLVDAEHDQPLSYSHKIPKYPLILSHVCTSWRQIISRSPSLWSRIRFSSNLKTNKLLKTYLDFHSSQAGKAPMDISISGDFTKGTPEIPDLSAFMASFTGRIKSLGLQLNLRGDQANVAVSKAQGGSLIAQCLQASNYSLKRLTFNMVSRLPRHLFMEGVSEDTDRNNLIIDLPHDELESALSPIADLWLRGLYFHWESKAYHGLIALRLDHSRSASISELQLASLLASSPQLRWLDIGLNITRAIDASTMSPIRLLDLEHLVGEAALLRLIQPGSNELTLSIIGESSCDSDILYDAAVRGFFSCANIVNFYSDDFLCSVSDMCFLLSFTPHIRDLAISHITLSGSLHGMLTYHSFDTLYLLEGCRLEWSLLRDMIDKWTIKRLVFWGVNYIIRDTPKIINNQLALEKEMSDIPAQNIRFELALDMDGVASPMDLFVGPPFK